VVILQEVREETNHLEEASQRDEASTRSTLLSGQYF
jgi:hypothetical protein